MRASNVTAQEQYRLIMECRSSGLTDYQWCMEHDIKPGTFYNWVKRLRQKGCVDIPKASKYHTPVQQEVVKLEINHPDEAGQSASKTELVSVTMPPADFQPMPVPTIELIISGDIIRIPNGADPILLEQTIRLLKGLSC